MPKVRPWSFGLACWFPLVLVKAFTIMLLLACLQKKDAVDTFLLYKLKNPSSLLFFLNQQTFPLFSLVFSLSLISWNLSVFAWMIEMCQKISFYMQTNYRSHSCVTQCDSSQQDTNDLLNGLLIFWKVITYSKRMGKGNLKNDDDCERRLLPSWYFILRFCLFCFLTLLGMYFLQFSCFPPLK